MAHHGTRKSITVSKDCKDCEEIAKRLQASVLAIQKDQGKAEPSGAIGFLSIQKFGSILSSQISRSSESRNLGSLHTEEKEESVSQMFRKTSLKVT